MRVDSRAPRRVDSRASTAVRTLSNMPSVVRAKPVIKTKASSVSTLPLPSTRSYTCSENIGTDSINTLIAKLIIAATPSGERAASNTIRLGVEAGSARTSVSFPA